MPKHRFAATAMTGSRFEIGVDRELQVLSGQVPPGLQGDWFVICANGDARSALPSAHNGSSGYRGSTTPFLNGDGFVTRVRFDGGKASVIKRLVRTPCYEVDRHTYSTVAKTRFTNFGLTRQALALGARNYANTALQLVRFGAKTHLLATYDAGAPVLLDPNTLRVRGLLNGTAWVGQIARHFPFRLISATAHPAWDGHTQTFYGLEYGRTLVGFMASLVRLIKPPRNALGPDTTSLAPSEPLGSELDPEAFAEEFIRDDLSDRENLDKLKAWLEAQRVAMRAEPESFIGPLETDSALSLSAYLDHLWRRIDEAVNLRDELIARAPADAPRLSAPFLRILTWRGGAVSWREVRDPLGKRVRIKNSAHTMAVTRHYVIVVDTAFKFELDLALPHPLDPSAFYQWFRRRISAPQPLTARAWVIPRAALASADDKPVRAYGYEVAAEVVHLLADYDDKGGTEVILHALDNRASDPAEFVLAGDKQALAGSRIDPRVHGMMPAGLDTNAMQTFALRIPATPGFPPPGADKFGLLRATPLGRAQTLPGSGLPTWTIALGSAKEVAGLGPQPERFTDSFWYGHGLAPEMVHELSFDLYDHHDSPRRPRTTPMSTVRKLLADGGLPGGLFHFRHDVAKSEYRVHASFPAPAGVTFTSPQLVHSSPGVPARSWLLCAVWRDTRTLGDGGDVPLGPTDRAREIWIFDAEKLAAGPLCRLDADLVHWPYTLHTAWLGANDRPPADPEDNGPRPGFRREDFTHVRDKQVRTLLEASLGWESSLADEDQDEDELSSS